MSQVPSQKKTKYDKTTKTSNANDWPTFEKNWEHMSFANNEETGVHLHWYQDVKIRTRNRGKINGYIVEAQVKLDEHICNIKPGNTLRGPLHGLLIKVQGSDVLNIVRKEKGIPGFINSVEFWIEMEDVIDIETYSEPQNYGPGCD